MFSVNNIIKKILGDSRKESESIKDDLCPFCKGSGKDMDNESCIFCEGRGKILRDNDGIIYTLSGKKRTRI